jgi:hypothetical protein
MDNENSLDLLCLPGVKLNCEKEKNNRANYQTADQVPKPGEAVPG